MPATDHAQLDRVIAFAGKVLNRADGEWQALQNRARTRADRRPRGDPGGRNQPNQAMQSIKPND